MTNGTRKLERAHELASYLAACRFAEERTWHDGRAYDRDLRKRVIKAGRGA